MFKLPHNFKRKRLTVSVVILLLACAVLYPYLTTRNRAIPRKLRSVDRTVALSLVKSAAMARGICEKGTELNIAGTENVLSELSERLLALRTAVGEMPAGEKDLTPQAVAAQKELDSLLAEILTAVAKGE